MEYKKVKPKDLKKHGKMVNGELHLKEGVYCINSPSVDVDVLNIKTLNYVSKKD